jgi:hypothetical protein
MTREEKVQAIQDMDAVIERAGNLCQSYELAQMDNCGASEGNIQTASREESRIREGIRSDKQLVERRMSGC